MKFRFAQPGKSSTYPVKKFLAIWLLVISCIGITHSASALQAVARHNLFFQPDKATGQLKPYLEIYFEVDPQTILFQKTDSTWQAKIRADITISSGSTIASEEHYILETVPVNQGVLTLTQRVMDLRRFPLSAGNYIITVKLSDQIKKENELTITDSVTILPLQLQPEFSDIQIVDTFFASDLSSIFKRNNFIQVPLPSNFLEERRNLHFYAELYQPEFTANPTDSLIRKVFISKKEMEAPVHSLMLTDTIPASQLTAIQGSFRIATLSSGNYHLNMSLENKQQQKLATKSLFFQVLNKKPEALPVVVDTSTRTETVNYLNLGKTFVAKYTGAQVRAILKMMIPVANQAEQARITEFLRSTDEMYARYFIYNFWTTQNPANPEEAWKNYTEKVKTVNKAFGSSMKPGYETDRGIIELRYGKPTERITVNNEAGALPYELWQYNSMPGAGNVVFLFYRPRMVNQFELLHSTIPAETRNRHWRSYLYPTGTSADPNNSKAELYIGNR